ncbi:hypothetical protein ES703_64483 [subsurface metagenome]
MIEMEKTGKDKKSIRIKKKSLKKNHHPVNILQSRFYDELKIAEIEDFHISFDNIVEEITKQGEKFSKKPTYEELKIYKSMIMQFLQYVTENMILVEHYTSSSHMKQKIYTVTKIIDDRLNALTKLVMTQQAHNINLLATLDEIRGLLVDLYK